MFWIETGLVLVSLLVAFTFPSLGSKWFERLEQCLARLARRRTLSVLLLGLSALILRAALLPIFPVPQPVVHDEFGYLLAADTYAHERLTTPTHPMWVHFETFSILQKPTYQCYAQPAQGMILAFGERVFGHPFWGVWLSAGLMCAAITWMLQGWLPPEWALLGGALAVLRYGVITYWANSYWGGAAGAIGGALVIGALPRIKSSLRVRDALLMGLGLAILANSRPYEGFVFSLPVAVALFAWMLGKNQPRFQTALRRVVLPLALTLMLTATGLGYYFWRVTGSPVRMPYQIERMQNGIAPLMIWQHLRPEPTYHHAVIKKMYVDEELPAYKLMSSPAGTVIKAFWGWRFYLGPLLTFPALMMIFVLPYGFGWKHIMTETRFLILTLGVFTIGLVLEPFYSPHYSSPATAIVLALVVKAIRYMSDWRVGEKPSGLFLARAIPVIAVFMFVLRAAAGPLHIPVDHAVSPAWNEQGPRDFGRSIVVAQLAAMPGQQLVIVRYKPTHEPFEEWVYNVADIDNSKVVWAREMDGADDRQLIQYFKSRQVWLLEADEKPPRLTPYTTSGSAETGR
jgi:hypothetical protein